MDKERYIMIFRLIATAALVAFAILTKGSPLSITLYICAYLVIGVDIVLKALRNICHGEVFDENFLMSIATIGALAIGEYPEAVAVMALYQFGEMLSDIAVSRSRSSISSLIDNTPEYANVEDADHTIRKVSPEEVAVGSIIVVHPGERIPLDGIIISGTSDIDTSALTGESMPRAVAPDDNVLAGSLNLGGALKLRTTADYSDSSVAKMLQLIENAENGKANTEKFITRFARCYTPIVVAAACLLALIPPLLFGGEWSVWLNRALIFLVISCPCALVISIPLTFFAGIGKASRQGILFKGSNYMESLAKARSVVFDKTGTLTYGNFSVAAIHPEIISADELLELATITESLSNHPVAVSLRSAYKGAIDPDKVSDLHEYPGEGISANVDSRQVFVGNERFMTRLGIAYKQCHCIGTIIHIAVDMEYMGHIVIADTIKEQSAATIEALHNRGIADTIILTGDKDAVAAATAEQLSVSRYYAELMPDDKVRHIEQIKATPGASPVVFVGDGINDAPVLKTADVGIAMGAAGSDAAIEAADIVLMNDNPCQVVDGIDIARKVIRLVRQNIVFALSVKAVLLIISALGWSNMWCAVFADVGVTLLVILNSLRAMRN